MKALLRFHTSSLLAFSIALLLIFGATACSSFDPEPDVPKAQEWVALPAEFKGDYFFLPMALEGDAERVLWFLYDTGASHTVVDRESLRSVSAWEPEQGSRIQFGTLQCGETKFHQVSAKVMSLQHLKSAVGRDFDGILAYSAFAEVLLNLDYPESTLRIAKGHLPRVNQETIFEIHGTNLPYYDVTLGSTTRRLLIDSGSGLGFEVHANHNWNWAIKPIVVGSSVGVDGLQFNYAGRLEAQVDFFGTHYENPILRISEGIELVGTEILRDYSLTFDQGAQRLEVLPAETLSPKPRAYRGTGAIFRPKADGMEVIRLVPGSPAEKVGMQIGDHVERSADLHYDQWERASSRSYFMRRGGKRFRLEVPVVDLIPVR